MDELDYKLESDIRSKKLYFLSDYLKEHDVQGDKYSVGYLPILMVFNPNSNSTPKRLVQTPNRSAPAKIRSILNSTFDGSQQNNNDDKIQNSFCSHVLLFRKFLAIFWLLPRLHP